jgi:threonine/homoserine/homoserine lactone efflux protein
MNATLPGFALASTLLIIAPGPDSMLVLRNTLRGGRRAGWVTAGGTVSGLLLWGVAAALGLSALVEASRLGYDILRFAGAAYLIWLGVTSFGLRRPRSGETPAADGPPAEVRRSRAYLNGVVSNLCNPKIGVFFVAFLPGFVPAGDTSLSLVLGLWFAVETGLWLGLMAWLAARGVGWMRRRSVQRWLERLTGVVLIGFGLRLATETR